MPKRMTITMRDGTAIKTTELPSHLLSGELPWFLGKDSHLSYLADVPYLVLDWETTNLEYGNPINPDNRLVLGCWLVVEPDGTIKRKHKFGDEYDYQ